jgi:RNA polymerase sigma-70 factor (ECF subfamily)
MPLVHPRNVQAEGDVVGFPAGEAAEPLPFEVFFEEQRQRLFKALYFVTGNREDAEEITQDAFLKLWERWDRIDRIDDPTAYLFRIALNGFRMRRRRAALAVRKVLPVSEPIDAFTEAEMRADVRQLLLGVTPRQRAALLLVDLLGYPSETAGEILRVRPSTVRALAAQGRAALRAEGANDA